MTERKKREQNLREAKERAEKMNRLKTAFLANMSHEIRTPLTSIIGFAEVLADEVSGPREEMADLIQRSGGRLKETLTSVLDFARLEGEAMSLSPERLDLVERVRETVELLRPQIQEKALTLTLDLPETSVEARMDGAALDRVLTNLLTNAIKFTEEGRITVALQADDEDVALTVEDTGSGIGEEFLEHIYDAFEQESSGTARTHEGIGLGLTITQRLVDLMDGTIEIESTEGEGTRVTVRLPRTGPDDWAA
jgi:signal transduction histidine kinase